MPHALISPSPACPPSQSSCSVLPLRLPDAHCHPQQGPDSQERLQRVQAPAVAVMGVSEGDWERVLELQRALPRKSVSCSSPASAAVFSPAVQVLVFKSTSPPLHTPGTAPLALPWRQPCVAPGPPQVIPCLGIHPWYAHLHAPLPLPHPTVPALLPPASTPPSGMEPHSGKDPDTSPSTQRPPLSAYPPTPTSTASPCSPPLPLPPPASHSHSPSSNSQNGIGLTLQQLGLLDLPQGTDRDQEAVRQLLASCPSVTWAGRLRQLLTEVPGAVLGECGLDRAAVVPGTKASQSLPHQLSLLRTQLALAAQLQRPASLHCVRATGHMMALLSSTPSEELPPRIMLHSFNGPPDSIKQLLALPRGVGSRLYFSFSATINARSGAGRDKLVARIRAVPQDRLLAETDEDDARRMDAALGAVLQLVAEARGWTPEQVRDVATELLTANFEAFYDTFLPPGYVMQRRVQAGPEAAPKNPALGHIVVCALYAMQLEEEAAIESQKRWGTRKQLVVFFGNAGNGTRGGWGAKAVLQACHKVVERPNSGKPTDRVPGKVVTVDEFRTSRVSSAMNSPQPCEAELDRSKPTRLKGWKPQPGQLHQATPGDLGKWVDRDCNAALNLQRAGESKWRPLELCRWPHRARLLAKGREYPALGFKKLRDQAPKALAQQPVAQ
ncbi:hypothetical protein QJQ45_012179 [Haematococcus lacustris]|nr:hypothetical protein QJQ45_012179 [Haematococcus lacustris]